MTPSSAHSVAPRPWFRVLTAGIGALSLVAVTVQPTHAGPEVGSHRQVISALPGASGINDGDAEAVTDHFVSYIMEDTGLGYEDAAAYAEWSGMFTAELSALLGDEDPRFARAVMDRSQQRATVHLVAGTDPRGLNFSSDVRGTVNVVADAKMSSIAASILATDVERGLRRGGVGVDHVTVNPLDGKVAATVVTNLPATALGALAPGRDVSFTVRGSSAAELHVPTGGALWHAPRTSGQAYTSLNVCTTAFAVYRTTSSDRGFLSAGHCADNGYSVTSNYAGQTEVPEVSSATSSWFYNDSRGDVAWMDSDSGVLTDNHYINAAHADADPMGRAVTVIGNTACVYPGRTIRDGGADYCGRISADNAAKNSAHVDGGAAATQGGDSGSPWFSYAGGGRTMQLGIHGGGTGSKAYYTRITTVPGNLPSGWYFYYDA